MNNIKNIFDIKTDGTLNGDLVANLDQIKVNGVIFNGISSLLTVNTKTYIESPERQNDGSISNINDYDTFVVPRCTVRWDYMSIGNYQKFCQAIQPNEFIVEYYDKMLGRVSSYYMYIEPEEMVKIYNIENLVTGIIGFEVSFIGTLNNLDKYKIVYDKNGGNIYSYKGQYNNLTTYVLGDIVLSNNKYSRAKYEEDTFSNQPITSTTYWNSITISQYSPTTEYSKGNVCYIIVNGTNKYYKSTHDTSFSGITPPNISYWEEISIKEYSSLTTYSRYDVCSSNNTYYQAVYYVNSFVGHYTDETNYWESVDELNGIESEWGRQYLIELPNDLFVRQGYTFVKYNSKADGTGYDYFPNIPTAIYSNLTLYSIWSLNNG